MEGLCAERTNDHKSTPEISGHELNPIKHIILQHHLKENISHYFVTLTNKN